MSSLQIARNTKIVVGPEGSQDHMDPKPCSPQTSTFDCSTTPSPTPDDVSPTESHLKTAYGMVVWPTLPGIGSASSVAPTRPIHALQVNEEDFRPLQAGLPTTMALGRQQFNNCNKLATSPTRASPLRAACDSCHRMKRKCDGKHPCARCDRRGRDCFYSCKQKSGPPKGSKRKLLEEEGDLLENRANRPINPGWPRCNRAAMVGGTTRSIVQIDPTVTGPETTPSPEARAAAAAAVAASRMTGMASGMNPALAVAGLRPPYMLTPPPVLPGLSASSVPATAPLVTHPQYSTVYQHQYPPEVYAVYLAELRQRGCSPNGVNSNSSTMPAPFAGPVGLGCRQSPAEAAQAAANALAADVAAARNFSPVMSTARDTPNNDESGAMNLTEQVPSLADETSNESGRGSDGAPMTDDVTPSEVSDSSAKGSSISLDERAKNAAASAAASAALAAAVAAAIAEGSPPDNFQQLKPQIMEAGIEMEAGDDDKTGQHLDSFGVPAKGSRYDVLPKAGFDVTPSTSPLMKDTILGRVIKSEEANCDSGASAPLSDGNYPNGNVKDLWVEMDQGESAQELESHRRGSPKPVTQIPPRPQA